MKKLLSGNEALALGAYHSGVKVATAFPGTPNTEILESMAQFKESGFGKTVFYNACLRKY